MSKAVYVATMESGSGKSIVTLGLMQMLLGKVAKVGYFKPIISDFKDKKKDNHIDTVKKFFNLDINFDDAYAFTKSQVLENLHNGNQDYIIDKIIEKFKALETKYDFILVEGTDFSGEGTATELKINSDIAKNLGIPTIIVESGTDKSLEDFANNMYTAYDLFKENEVEVLAIIANRINTKNLNLVKEALQKRLPKKVVVCAIPEIQALSQPTIKEVKDELKAKVLFGKENLHHQISGFVVGAMQLPNFLPRIINNSLMVTPGDRADLLLGALQAHISENYPKLSGILLTGGIKPKPAITKLIDGLHHNIPILIAKEGTFKVASKVGKVKPKIYPDNTEKINLSIQVFEKYVDVERLANSLVTFQSKGITPRMFQYNLLQRAKKEKKHIVLPEGEDLRILKAAIKLIKQDVVKLTILGNHEIVKENLKKFETDFDTNQIEIINPQTSNYFKDYAKTYYELRKHKGINLAMAEDIMLNVSYFGTMMVYKGDADGMVSGAAHTTQHTILPALQFIKTKPGASIVSSVFFMCLEDRVSVFGDCAINPNPNAEQLAEIAISSADTSANFGIEPKIAMLSYSSGNSGVGADVDKVRKATELVKEKRPDLKVEGPIQYDAAVDATVGKSKLPNSEVAGEASVLIFPDLNTGNNTYKAVQRETGALAIGPMLQGLNKPVNDLSRGCTVEDIYNTVIITAIQAQEI
ncbi:MAG TPA: phosphate acetyltransferase [Flavobacteriia bacterium]|nr:phosphate acetyltransferase [Flavobacteriia bacterium]